MSRNRPAEDGSTSATRRSIRRRTSAHLALRHDRAQSAADRHAAAADRSAAASDRFAAAADRGQSAIEREQADYP